MTRSKARGTIALGGVGADSHSVGLHVLRHALEAQRYDVRFLGIHNEPSHFSQIASEVDVVMISTLDGHATFYFRAFRVPPQDDYAPTLWYIGGNLSTDDGLSTTRFFLSRGFHRVYPKYVELARVLGELRYDLQARRSRRPKRSPSTSQLSRFDGYPCDSVLSSGGLSETREAVLSEWETGNDARSLRENASYLVKAPLLANAQELLPKPILQPRVGVASPQHQLLAFEELTREGAGACSFQIDSLTRLGKYSEVQELLKTSAEHCLNGFPMVNLGPRIVREIVERTSVPVQTRHSARDPRLLAEISFAGGVSAFEGGPICYNVPYYADLSLKTSIENWRYVDALSALYRQYGVKIDREFFGTLTATLIPPCLAITTCALEALLAAQQGVETLSVGYAEQGNRVQDVAAIRAMRSIVTLFLSRYGYSQVRVATVFHQYMAAFPATMSRASELITGSAVTAWLSGATRILTKTPSEAFRLPTIEDNVTGLRLILQAIGSPPRLEKTGFWKAVLKEEAIIRAETVSILDSVLQVGEGDISRGIAKSFDLGLLDIPFCPSVFNKGRVMTLRDSLGAVRFARFGGLSLPKEIREFHSERVSERRLLEGLTSTLHDYALVEKDTLMIPREDYECWPLDLYHFPSAAGLD